MELSYFNPWWYYDEWWKSDRHLKLWESGPRWIPLWIYELSTEPLSLNFVYGPRQVGKTTGIKLLIRELISKGVDPGLITYVDVDIFANLEQFAQWLEEFATEKPTSTRYLFLDEVTSIEGWWRPLKALIDAGLMENVVVTVTASSSIFLRKDTEVFPGRRGRGVNVEVLPLDYPSFELITKGFRKYLRIGGFPRAIRGDMTFFSDFLSSIKREVLQYGYDPSIAMEILITVARKAPSPLSYNTIASEIGTSHSVVRRYIKLLSDLYVIREIMHYGKHMFRKEKKIIFRDPGIMTALETYGVEVDDAVRLEMVVQEHLARKYGQVYYERRDGETDVVVNGQRYEVKLTKEGKNVINLSNVENFLRSLFKPSIKVL